MSDDPERLSMPTAYEQAADASREASRVAERGDRARRLVSELRAMGFAVQIFEVGDVCPDFDYSSEGGEDAWFAAHRRELEDRLAEFGNNELDRMASNELRSTI